MHEAVPTAPRALLVFLTSTHLPMLAPVVFLDPLSSTSKPPLTHHAIYYTGKKTIHQAFQL